MVIRVRMKKRIYTVIIAIFIMILVSCNFDLENINKDDILEKYDRIIGVVGETVLTEDNKLKGDRKFGIDTYVGSYEVKYNSFTGEEVLFGGTNIKKENTDLKVTWEIEKENGNIELLYYHGSKKPQVLNKKERGNIEISIGSGSHYISLKATSFSGKVSINVGEY